MVVIGYWQLEVYRNPGPGGSGAAGVSSAGSDQLCGPRRSSGQRRIRAVGDLRRHLRSGLAAAGAHGGQNRQFRVLSGLRQADGSRGGGGTRRRLRNGDRTDTAQRSRPTGRRPAAQRGTSAGEPIFSSGQIASVRLPALAQQWPGPMIGGFVTLSSADAAGRVWRRPSCGYRRRPAGCVMGRTRCSGGCSPRSRSLWPSG